MYENTKALFLGAFDLEDALTTNISVLPWEMADVERSTSGRSPRISSTGGQEQRYGSQMSAVSGLIAKTGDHGIPDWLRETQRKDYSVSQIFTGKALAKEDFGDLSWLETSAKPQRTFDEERMCLSSSNNRLSDGSDWLRKARASLTPPSTPLPDRAYRYEPESPERLRDTRARLSSPISPNLLRKQLDSDSELADDLEEIMAQMRKDYENTHSPRLAAVLQNLIIDKRIKGKHSDYCKDNKESMLPSQYAKSQRKYNENSVPAATVLNQHFKYYFEEKNESTIADENVRNADTETSNPNGVPDYAFWGTESKSEMTNKPCKDQPDNASGKINDKQQDQKPSGKYTADELNAKLEKMLAKRSAVLQQKPLDVDNKAMPVDNSVENDTIISYLTVRDSENCKTDRKKDNVHYSVPTYSNEIISESANYVAAPYSLHELESSEDSNDEDNTDTSETLNDFEIVPDKCDESQNPRNYNKRSTETVDLQNPVNCPQFVAIGNGQFKAPTFVLSVPLQPNFKIPNRRVVGACEGGKDIVSGVDERHVQSLCMSEQPNRRRPMTVPPSTIKKQMIYQDARCGYENDERRTKPVILREIRSQYIGMESEMAFEASDQCQSREKCTPTSAMDYSTYKRENVALSKTEQMMNALTDDSYAFADCSTRIERRVVSQPTHNVKEGAAKTYSRMLEIANEVRILKQTSIIQSQEVQLMALERQLEETEGKLMMQENECKQKLLATQSMDPLEIEKLILRKIASVINRTEYEHEIKRVCTVDERTVKEESNKIDVTNTNQFSSQPIQDELPNEHVHGNIYAADKQMHSNYRRRLSEDTIDSGNEPRSMFRKSRSNYKKRRKKTVKWVDRQTRQDANNSLRTANPNDDQSSHHGKRRGIQRQGKAVRIKRSKNTFSEIDHEVKNRDSREEPLDETEFNPCPNKLKPSINSKNVINILCFPRKQSDSSKTQEIVKNDKNIQTETSVGKKSTLITAAKNFVFNLKSKLFSGKQESSDTDEDFTKSKHLLDSVSSHVTSTPSLIVIENQTPEQGKHYYQRPMVHYQQRWPPSGPRVGRANTVRARRKLTTAYDKEIIDLTGVPIARKELSGESLNDSGPKYKVQIP